MPISIHIACDHQVLRKGIDALLDRHDELVVQQAGPEGTEGVKEVEGTDSDVLILAVPPKEDVAKHAKLYREASPSAGIVGFCFLPEQAEDYLESGIEEVVSSDVSTAEFIEAIKRAADSAAEKV